MQSSPPPKKTQERETRRHIHKYRHRQTQPRRTHTHGNSKMRDRVTAHPAIIIYFRNLAGPLDVILFISRFGTIFDGIRYAAHRTHTRVITQADANMQP
jgi:hypothetical protein